MSKEGDGISPEFQKFTKGETLAEPEEEKAGEYPEEGILKPESLVFKEYDVSKPRRITIHAKILDD